MSKEGFVNILKYCANINGSNKFKDFTQKQNSIQYSVSAILLVHVGISVTSGEFYFKNVYQIFNVSVCTEFFENCFFTKVKLHLLFWKSLDVVNVILYQFSCMLWRIFSSTVSTNWREEFHLASFKTPENFLFI